MTSSPPSELTAQPVLDSLFLSSFLKLASVQPSERVLDLSGRGGEMILEAARRAAVGPDSEQLLLERDPERLAAFLARARAEGATDLQGAVYTGGRLPSSDSYWDVALCHLGLTESTEPETLLRETLRIMRPVGRFAVSVWGERARCPLLTIFLDAVTPFNPAAATVDRACFQHGASGKLALTLSEAGFEDATPERLTEWVAFRDLEEYWRTLASDPRFAPLIEALTEEQIAAAQETIAAKTKFYRRREGLELKVEGIILAAVK